MSLYIQAMFEMTNKHYVVGQNVRLLCDIREDGEDLPPRLLARTGETLVIRGVCKCTDRPLSVSHLTVIDGSTFSVDYDEVEFIPLREAAEATGGG